MKNKKPCISIKLKKFGFWNISLDYFIKHKPLKFMEGDAQLRFVLLPRFELFFDLSILMKIWIKFVVRVYENTPT